jgi:hypothetical protein
LITYDIYPSYKTKQIALDPINDDDDSMASSRIDSITLEDEEGETETKETKLRLTIDDK